MSDNRRYTKTFKQPQDAQYGKDIRYGLATVKAWTRRGVVGWDLPGGKFTSCMKTAVEKAVEINRLIKANGSLPSWAGVDFV